MHDVYEAVAIAVCSSQIVKACVERVLHITLNCGGGGGMMMIARECNVRSAGSSAKGAREIKLVQNETIDSDCSSELSLSSSRLGHLTGRVLRRIAFSASI